MTNFTVTLDNISLSPILLFISFTALPIVAISQDLIDVKNPNNFIFDTQQQSRWDYYDTSSIYSDIELVELADIDSIQENGILNIQIPFRSDTLAYKTFKAHVYEDSSFFAWHGRMINDTAGSAMIVQDTGTVNGYINYDNQSYEFRHLGDSLNVLLEVDTAYGDTLERTEASSDTLDYDLDTLSLRSCNKNIRVLFLFTPEAAESSDPVSYSRFVIKQMNFFLRNSEVNPSEVEFSWAGATYYDEIVESNWYGDQIPDPMFVTFIGQQQLSNSERDQYQADIAVLLTENGFSNGQRIFDGAVYKLEDAVGDEDLAFAWARIVNPTSNFVVAHELAHLLGAREPDGNADNVYISDYANAKEYTCYWDIFDLKTIVTDKIIDNDEIHIPYFSNPDVKFYCEYTGDLNERDNAQQMRDMGCIVAEYRDFNPPVQADIRGPHRGNNSGTYEWCASVTECNNITSYTWESSTDGFNYSTVSTTQCHGGQLPNDKNLFLRLTVTCADGSSDTDWHFVQNTSNFPFKLQSQANASVKESEKIVKFELYPNPVSSQLNGEIEFTELNGFNISYLNLQGRVVSSYDIKTEETSGIYEFSHDLNTIETGYYLVLLTVGEEIISKTIIISK